MVQLVTHKYFHQIARSITKYRQKVAHVCEMHDRNASGMNRPPQKKSLTSQAESADELVPSDGVKVHDLDVERAVADLLPGDVELEAGVEDGVQVALVDRRLLLLHPFIAEHQPYFDVGI